MSFHSAFRRSLRVAARTFGEDCWWTHEGVQRAAITVGGLTAQQRSMLGGRFGDATIAVSMTAELWHEARADGAESGSLLTVSGPDLPPTEVRIMDVVTPGNGSIVLACGPAGISTPRR